MHNNTLSKVIFFSYTITNLEHNQLVIGGEALISYIPITHSYSFQYEINNSPASTYIT